MKKQLILLYFVFTLTPFVAMHAESIDPPTSVEYLLQLLDEPIDATITVSGYVRNTEGEPMEDIEVCLDANLIEFPRCLITDEDGFYSFKNVQEDIDYSLTAKNDKDHLEKVSTLDFVMIIRHLIGIEKFESPYHLIAADANADNKVSILDLSDIRKLILGVYGKYPTNTSYRFVNAGYTFEDENNPWPDENNEPYEILFNPTSDVSYDFIGIKVGHVNF